MPYLYRIKQGGRVWVTEEQLRKEATNRERKRLAWHEAHPTAKYYKK